MSRSSTPGAVLYERETAWAEATDTWASRLAVINKVDLSGLQQAMIERGVIGDRKQHGTTKVPGVYGGEFKVSFHLPGHGSSTSGATSISELATLLGDVIGSAAVSASAGTTLTGGTANVPTTTASGTFSSGALCRIGALGDGRGAGQAYAISSHTTTSLTLLTNLPASPSNADVLYSGDMVWSEEDPTSAAIYSYRFLLMTANQQFACRGCYPKSFTISALNAGEIPTIEITYGVSWFKPMNETFPTAVALPTAAPAPNTSGSLWFGTKGVATYGTKTPRSVQIDYTLGIKELMSINAATEGQVIVGAVRTPDQIKFTMTLDANDASTTPAELTAWAANSEKHALLTLNSSNGKCVAVYLPRLCYSGNKPTQMDGDGINRQTLEFAAYESGSGSTDLQTSAFRMLLA